MKIAVVGEGIIGTAIAFFLAHSGADVTLIGSRTTGPRSATDVSGGLLRVLDPDKATATVAKRGVMALRHWARLGLPGECGYTPCGAVFLAPESDGIAYEQLANELNSEDYPMHRLSDSAFSQKFGMLQLPPGACVFQEPFGGYGSPSQTRDSLLQAFVQMGGEYKALRVEEVISSNSALSQVRCANSRSDYDLVVVAAGRGTGPLLANSGFTLTGDSVLTSRTIAIPHLRTENPGARTSNFPIIVDLVSGTFLRPLGVGKFIVGAGNDGDIVDATENPRLHDQHILDAMERISKSVSGLNKQCRSRGAIGVDAYTTQGRPVVGVVLENPCIFVASGFSGRGYKLSMPVSASIAMDILLRGSMKASTLTQTISAPSSLIAALSVNPEIYHS